MAGPDQVGWCAEWGGRQGRVAAVAAWLEGSGS